MASERAYQNERTALAWQRTALSLMVAAVVLARLGYERLGPVAVALAGLGLVISGWVFWTSRAKYRSRAGIRLGRPAGGRSSAALAATVALLAAMELANLLGSP